MTELINLCTHVEGEFAEVLEALDLATLGHPVVAHGVVVGCKLKSIFTDKIPTGSSGFHSAKGSAKSWTPGLENFITAVAYHFCPSLPASFTQPGASTLADLCIRF